MRQKSVKQIFAYELKIELNLGHAKICYDCRHFWRFGHCMNCFSKEENQITSVIFQYTKFLCHSCQVILGPYARYITCRLYLLDGTTACI